MARKPHAKWIKGSKVRLYHSLLTRNSPVHPWRIEFGDYDKECVEQEREDDYSSFSKKNVKIITTTDDQPSIQAAVDDLNAEHMQK